MDKKAIIEALRDKPQLGRPDIKGIPRRVTDAVNRNIATLLGTPVDAVTNAINLGIAGAGTLGHKLGLVSTPPNVIESPIGGSEWFGQQMEQRGMVSPERNTYNEVMAGLLMPAATTRAAKTLFNAEQQAARNIAAPDTLNTPGFRGQRGAIVWHGSPHKFDAFDASKIGTGEGAQAYGHGMYFAESPDVANVYKNTLSADLSKLSTTGEFMAARALAETNYDAAAAIKNLSNGSGVIGGAVAPENAKKYVEAALPKIGRGEGQFYKVDLPDEAIARMLDWDKPLNQQAQVVSALRPVSERVPGLSDALQEFELGSTTGQAVNNYISKALSPADAARLLKDAGIPGIRYLDEGSRGAGAGTSNFVVFPGEERLLRILERNNQPMGLMGAPKQTGLQATKALSNNLDDVRYAWNKSGVEIDAYPSRNNEINLSRIVVDKSKRNQGLGTAAMQDLIQYADDTGKTIKLSPSTDFGGTSVNRLKEFYKRFGFVENKGKNKDFTISELMYRTPKTNGLMGVK
jgi:predicted GNAT family acetyltransferase